MKSRISKLSIVSSLLLSMGLTTVVMADNNNTTTALAKVSKSFPWINLTVPYATTVQELAGMYYSDENDYVIIYNANKDVIPKSLKLRKGMIIKIPVTDKFTDQPERLGWN